MTSRWTESLLRAMSEQTDPVADALIADIIDNDGIAALKALFRQLDDNDDILLQTGVSPPIRDYFQREMTLPEWADAQQIQIAQQLFAANAPMFTFLLNFRALPLCYVSANGAKVLYATGRLHESGEPGDTIVRRLMETAQMVLHIMSPDGFAPEGKGIVTIKKVRLIHAAIRHYLQHPHNGDEVWDVDAYGQPINQEEMAGVLMAFGPLSVSGLALLGIETTEVQREAYTHCWKIVGHFIGIDDALLPDNYQDGCDLGLAILARNHQHSVEGQVLTNSLLAFHKRIIPGYFFDDMPSYFIQRFTRDISEAIDVNLAQLIGISPNQSFKRVVVGWCLEQLFDRLGDLHKNTPWVASFIKFINVKILQGMIDFYSLGNNAQLYVPPSLKTDWKLK